MIYFDEAGNSGSNLLDKQQPVFVLASHDFSIDETNELLGPLFALSKAKELHFKNLKKYQKFRNALIEMFNNKRIQENRIYHYFANKKYMIAIQMVDMLIEPVMYDQGVDIYQYGSNISTANLLHMIGTTAWRDKYDHICSLFVKWVRSGNNADCVSFYDAILKLQKSTKEDYKDILTLILLSTQHLSSIIKSFTKYSLDATLSCFVDHCNFWAKKYEKPFDVVFDYSKQIEYWKDMINFLAQSLPNAEVGYGSRKHKYPLLINSVKTADSHSNVQIQLADLIASSISYVAGKYIEGKHDEFSNKIQESSLFNHTLGNRMWPGREVTPEELDMTDPIGTNPLDFLADSALKNPEKYREARDKK